MNKDVNIYSFNDECYVYLGDYRKLQQENEKLNHYKLLYQKVKERNDKAIEYLEREMQEGRSESNLWLMGCYDEDKKLLEILKGNNEVSNEDNRMVE